MAQEAKQKLTFAALVALSTADLSTHLKKIVKVDAAVTKAKDAFTGSLQFFGKVVAALKRRYVERLNSKEIPADTTFKKYFEQNADGNLPGRVEALASLFNALVLTVDAQGKPLLTEMCYDDAAVDWLEKANAIIKAAQKQHGDAWKTCDDVLDTVNALSKPGDALKKIKEIRARQKGTADEADAEKGDAVPLTVGRCIEFLAAAIAASRNMKEEEAYSLFHATISLGDSWKESGWKADTLKAWMAKYKKAKAANVAPHIDIRTSPAETPAPEAPAPAETPALPAPAQLQAA